MSTVSDETTGGAAVLRARVCPARRGLSVGAVPAAWRPCPPASGPERRQPCLLGLVSSVLPGPAAGTFIPVTVVTVISCCLISSLGIIEVK